MTEAEWLACDEPDPMLQAMRGQVSVRKLRLFAVACCRRAWPIYLGKRACRAVVLAERLAEGLPAPEVTTDFMLRLHDEGFSQVDGYREEKENNIRHHLANAGYHALQVEWELAPDPLLGDIPDFMQPDLTRTPFEVARAVAHSRRPDDRTPYRRDHVTAESRQQTVVARDIFGNPFRPVAVEPDWRTSTVVALARAIYHDRAFDRLPVLADALEDAGCDNAALLGHLRDPALTHVRGCWAVDLVLGLS